MRRKKGEVVTLYCSHCTWSTELSMAETAESRVVPCAHCGKSIHWHCCATCGLRYAGSEAPFCPICDDSSLDDLSTD